MTKLIRTTNEQSRTHLPYLNLQKAVESLFEDFFPNASNRNWNESASATLMSPKTDITETERGYDLKMEIPGVAEEAIDISISKGVLTVKAEKHAEKEEKNKQYHRIERSYGTFQRSIYLSEDVDNDKIDATYKNGVLHVFIPKSPQLVEETKKIMVHT